jgi:hypothetical protein
VGADKSDQKSKSFQTARMLGIDVPNALQLLADEVIE